MANPQEKAWSDGFAAGKRGRPESVCPYKKGGFMVAWQEGWRNGVKSRNSDS
ncbi:MAG: ribosome modulation factor [Candidatus Sphingomonas colombiensis]|nr:ribosome modulation factor [Sphingomonas sp.]WEK44531.1 MAG: ribosome modulation factor [Sphingomonas sp.]